jgi:hypothetical protein
MKKAPTVPYGWAFYFWRVKKLLENQQLENYERLALKERLHKKGLPCSIVVFGVLIKGRNIKILLQGIYGIEAISRFFFNYCFQLNFCH